MTNIGVSADKLIELQKPLKLKWRVQRAIPNKTNPTHVIMVGYVDARDVQDVLDKVCGPQNWQDDFYESKGKQFCKIGILCNGTWLWKSDSGIASQTEKEKGETSDAFKRAAVKWGINRYAYKVGEVKLACKVYGEKPYPCDEQGRFLKGEKLYEHCNKIGRVDDLEVEFAETWSDALSVIEQVELETKELRELFNLKEKALTEEEKINVERILNAKEFSSYKKIRKILQSK